MISDRPDETIVFLHIPKTAGTTLTRLLHGLERQDRVHAVPVNPVEIPPLDEMLEDLRRLPAAHLARLRLMTGHYPYGIHEPLPRPVRYITMLRDPVDRAVSLHDYIRFHHIHPLRDVAASMDLRTFVEQNVPGNLHDGQTVFLAGEGIHHRGGDRALLQRARANITRHFAAVGVQERFDESLVGFAAALGWNKLPCYERRNINRRSRGRAGIDDETVAVIEHYNALDRKLHTEALEALGSLVANAEPSLDATLLAWRRRCERDSARRARLMRVRSTVRIRTRARAGLQRLRESVPGTADRRSPAE